MGSEVIIYDWYMIVFYNSNRNFSILRAGKVEISEYDVYLLESESNSWKRLSPSLRDLIYAMQALNYQTKSKIIQ